jgi:hypothetical protein
VCCVEHFCNADVVGSTNTISRCSIVSSIHIGIPVNGCVGRGAYIYQFPPTNATVLHTKEGYGMIIFVPIKKKSIIYRKDTNNATTGHF